MSIAGIASTALFSVLNATQNTQGSSQGNFQQIQTEFQQLGQDLQAGNLSQAQQDYATFSQNFPNANNTGNSSSQSPIVQAFNQLSQDLQNGNLSAAQQDYSTIQQDFQQQQQGAGQVRHHHHHSGGGGEQNQINQAFQSLAQQLQSGSLSGAQSAFATLEQDLSQIGGFSSSNSTSGASSTQGANTSLNVTA
jgi:outer membrane protein assembly factor BamD (BamD/ComL family)